MLGTTKEESQGEQLNTLEQRAKAYADKIALLKKGDPTKAFVSYFNASNEKERETLEKKLQEMEQQAKTKETCSAHL